MALGTLSYGFGGNCKMTRDSYLLWNCKVLTEKRHCIYLFVKLIWVFLLGFIIFSSCWDGGDKKDDESDNQSGNQDANGDGNSDEYCDRQWEYKKDCALNCNEEQSNCVNDCALLEISEGEDCRILCHANKCRCFELDCDIIESCLYCYYQ